MRKAEWKPFVPVAVLAVLLLAVGLGAQTNVPAGLVCAAQDAGRDGVEAVGGGHQARHSLQRWTTRFDGRGVLITPDGGGWCWGLELVGYGRAGAERPVARPRSVTTEGRRVAYAWDPQLTEWYVNGVVGLEHGYTVHAPPVAPVAGLLALTLAVRGDLQPAVAANGRDVRFLAADGRAVLDYAGLVVLDADGRRLAAAFAHSGEGLRLTVDDAGARYPLTIDPIVQQAYLKASNTGPEDHFGYAVAVSGDTLVVGAWGEDGEHDTLEDTGAVYVFVRDGASWTQQALLKASNPGTEDFFGDGVAISGDTLVVAAASEDSSATGVDGDQLDESALSSGAVYVFVRDGTSWSQQAYLKASNTDAGDLFGDSVSISGDTLVVGARGEDSNATGVDGNQDDDTASFAGAVYVFVRDGTRWSQQAYLKASNTDAGDDFGGSVSIAGDTLAVGAYEEASSATGVGGNQDDDGTVNAGAVYVFVREGTTWSQQAYVKASNTDVHDLFGVALSLSEDAGTLVVGATGESSNATGVNGDQHDESALTSGAAYVFVREGTEWSQQAYLKASNCGAWDFFGRALSISGDTLVVGAYGEDSAATGVHGSQSGVGILGDWPGAAYLFARDGTTWSQQAYIKASNTKPGSQSDYGDQFGLALAISGGTLVVGAHNEDSFATGVNGDQDNDGLEDSGAAYVFHVDLGDVGLWTDLGGSTDGTYGPPVLTMSGLLEPATGLYLDLGDARRNAPAILFISFDSTPAAFIGGMLHAFPVDLLIGVATDGLGQIHGSAEFSGAAAGTGMWFQVGVFEPFSVPIYGGALSNGVRGIVP